MGRPPGVEEGRAMALLRPDPSFYASPRDAMTADREELAYVVTDDPERKRPDAITIVDVDERSSTHGEVVGRTDMPTAGDELHHFGWNACSAALCPYAPHPHVERRYLVVPGFRSSRIHILDTKPDPRAPKIVKVIEPQELARKTGYSRPHTSHCGPDALYMSALGDPRGDGPGGILLIHHETFEPLGRWEIDRGPQYLAYDFWWHLGYDTLITSEWGTPNMVEGGLDPELLLGKRYGRNVHVWDLRKRKHLEALPVGDDDQIVLELRPAHDPTRPYGFVGVVTNVSNLIASVWLWHLDDGGAWRLTKVIEIPPEPADADQLPELLKGFGAVPPLVTDIVLSLDDRFLYVSCWGTGELRQYDVSDPFSPKHTGSVRLGGIVHRSPHPASGAINGGPQMVELSRDGRRVYLTNSLYLSWDGQFYPEGIKGWLARIDCEPSGGMTVSPDLFIDFGDERTHQVRLAGGDSSSDSYCYP
jgi:selenium-binding protein 1